jgi:hypothetical protein
MAAESLCRNKSYLGQPKYEDATERRAEAITAAAHTIARTIYAMVTKREEYDEARFAVIEKRERERARHRLTKPAHKLGFVLTPLQPPAEFVS